MTYIRFANEINQPVNRLFLEKLGISTKRDSDATIGQFGSGSKFAPIAALRRGLEWAFSGYDDNGEYLCHYRISEQDGIDTVVFDYGDYVKESSYTADAGLLSWTDPFQIFREAFANCVDAHIEFGAKYSVELVDKIEPMSGYFCTFLQADRDLLEIFKDMWFYFKVDDEADHLLRFTYANSKIYDNDGRLGIYQKGILVNFDYDGEIMNESSLFSYCYDELPLNEERRMRYGLYDADSYFHSLMRSCKNAEIIDTMITEAAFSTMWYESNMRIDKFIWQWYKPNHSCWADGWERHFGDAVLVSPDADYDIMVKIKMRGRDYVQVKSDFWYDFLSHMGVTSQEDILGLEVEFNIVEPEGKRAEVFARAMDIVSQYDDRILSIDSIRVFSPSGSQDSILGVCRSDMVSKHIFISEEALDSLSLCIGTIIHELDHAVTGVGDGPSFRNFADDRIGNLLVMLYNKE